MASILYVPHGGGPLPLLGEPGHVALVRFLKQQGECLPEPEAIIVISAHWEADSPAVTSGCSPALIYDYSGFPAESYCLRYSAPGAPALAEDVVRLLEQAGLPARADPSRGFDHGLFVPLLLMYPEARIPCIQLSLLASLSASEHLAMGRALRALHDRNLLVLGSGFSFHNMQPLRTASPVEKERRNGLFQDWLIDVCCAAGTSEEARAAMLSEWEQAPFARYCHPREEHLLPLMVCTGMARGPAQVVFDGDVMATRVLAFYWAHT